MSTSRKCSKIKADGSACKAWAKRESDPPLCASHLRTWEQPLDSDRDTALDIVGEPKTQDISACGYTFQEIADLMRSNADAGLDDELTLARLAVRRLMAHLEEALTPHEFAHLTGAIFAGTNSIVRLIQAQQDLGNHSAGKIARAFYQALDELAKKRGLPL